MGVAGIIEPTEANFLSNWLAIERTAPRKPSQKTVTWIVRGKRSGILLGRIHWYGPWRQYVFYPEPETLFNGGCLREIASFCALVHKVRA